MPIKTVLIVDDVAMELKRLEQIVISAGYEALTATNGKEALEKIRTGRPDAVLLDVIMPDMNGFQVCRALKADEMMREIPVVLVTSKKEKSDKVWGLVQGARGYVTKPYTSAEIVTQLQAL